MIISSGGSILNIKVTLKAENYNAVEIPGVFPAFETINIERLDLILLGTGLADIKSF